MYFITQVSTIVTHAWTPYHKLLLQQNLLGLTAAHTGTVQLSKC